MAEVVAHDGTRLLVFTRSASPRPDTPVVHYGRILDLRTLRLWPERYLDSLAAHGQWEALDDPLPIDRLLAMVHLGRTGGAASVSGSPTSGAGPLAVARTVGSRRESLS